MMIRSTLLLTTYCLILLLCLEVTNTLAKGNTVICSSSSNTSWEDSRAFKIQPIEGMRSKSNKYTGLHTAHVLFKYLGGPVRILVLGMFWVGSLSIEYDGLKLQSDSNPIGDMTEWVVLKPRKKNMFVMTYSPSVDVDHIFVRVQCQDLPEYTKFVWPALLEPLDGTIASTGNIGLRAFTPPIKWNKVKLFYSTFYEIDDWVRQLQLKATTYLKNGKYVEFRKLMGFFEEYRGYPSWKEYASYDPAINFIKESIQNHEYKLVWAVWDALYPFRKACLLPTKEEIRIYATTDDINWNILRRKTYINGIHPIDAMYEKLQERLEFLKSDHFSFNQFETSLRDLIFNVRKLQPSEFESGSSKDSIDLQLIKRELICRLNDDGRNVLLMYINSKEYDLIKSEKSKHELEKKYMSLTNDHDELMLKSKEVEQQLLDESTKNEQYRQEKASILSKNSKIQGEYNTLSDQITANVKLMKKKDNLVRKYKDDEKQLKAQLNDAHSKKDELTKTNSQLQSNNKTLINDKKKISKELKRKMNDKATYIARLKRSKKKHAEYLKSYYEDLLLKKDEKADDSNTDDVSSVAPPNLFGAISYSDDYSTDDKAEQEAPDTVVKSASRSRNDNDMHHSSTFSNLITKMLGPSLLGCIIAGGTMVAVIFNILYQGAVGDWFRKNASC
eukprot:860839_1